MSQTAPGDRLLYTMSIQGRPVRQPVEALVVHITPWERATLQLLADGTSTSVLADRFQTSEADLEARLATLFGRMGVRSRAEAIRAAVRRGLVTAALRVGET